MGPCLLGGHVGSQVMAGALGLGLMGGRVFCQVMARAVGPGLLCGRVGFRGMAGAVGLWLSSATSVPGAWHELWARGCRATMFVPRSWRELWARGCRAAMLVARAWWELWALGCQAAMFFSGHAGSCGLGVAGGRVGSLVLAGAVVLGLPVAILFIGAWRELWVQGCRAAMLVFRSW